jgi:hypothetical protein
MRLVCRGLSGTSQRREIPGDFDDDTLHSASEFLAITKYNIMDLNAIKNKAETLLSRIVNSAYLLDQDTRELCALTDRGNAMRSILVGRNPTDITTFDEVFQSRLLWEQRWNPRTLPIVQGGVIQLTAEKLWLQQAREVIVMIARSGPWAVSLKNIALTDSFVTNLIGYNVDKKNPPTLIPYEHRFERPSLKVLRERFVIGWEYWSTAQEKRKLTSRHRASTRSTMSAAEGARWLTEQNVSPEILCPGDKRSVVRTVIPVAGVTHEVGLEILIALVIKTNNPIRASTIDNCLVKRTCVREFKDQFLSDSYNNKCVVTAWERLIYWDAIAVIMKTDKGTVNKAERA